MYEVYLYNHGQETCIHYPSADKDMPHLLKLSYKESLSQAEIITFTIPVNNQGYGEINELSTKIRVVTSRPNYYFLTENMIIEDKPVIFNGRVLNITDRMDDNGIFTKEVTCEGALNYLKDIHMRRVRYANKTPSQILADMLNKYNANAEQQILLGDIKLTQPLTLDFNYETILNCILKIRNILGGDIRVRETDGNLYLDYLEAQGENNEVEIRIGYNLKSYIKEYDPTDLITRCIGLGYGEGINQLTLEAAIGNDYIQDDEAINQYGIIEGIMTDKEIQDSYTLLAKTQTALAQNKQPKLIISANALDLSMLAGHEGEIYRLGDTIHIINDRLPTNYYLTENFTIEDATLDVYARVVERNFSNILAEAYSPDIVISTRPIRLTDEIIDLKQRNTTLENAPQGSTYIDTYGYAENIDAAHPFQLPVWLSPDILNINRVRLHIDSQKYRAYEKGMAAGGGTVVTSAEGGGTTVSSSGGGGTTVTSAGGGSTTATSSSGGGVEKTTASGGGTTVSSAAPQTMDFWEIDRQTTGGPGDHQHTYMDSFWDIDSVQDHTHRVTVPSHTHSISIDAHTHSVTIGSHTHDVTIPNHTHSVTIPNHTHTATIQPHTHELEYGIFEDTYPQNVYIKINGQSVAGPFAADGNAFSADIDLTPYINEPGATYNIEVTSSRNGRINAWVSIQAFIQAK